jgi:NADPH-dependent 2,4-dienoyl-CoA reductase/sulfur reductase-like enzyme
MHLVAIGGSDARISAALRARELDPTVDVTVVAADAYPNCSICGIPYHISGEVTQWRNLAYRSHADLQATGIRLRLDTTTTIDRRGRASRGAGSARAALARPVLDATPRPPWDAGQTAAQAWVRDHKHASC